jgi:hypothetical protein
VRREPGRPSRPHPATLRAIPDGQPHSNIEARTPRPRARPSPPAAQASAAALTRHLAARPVGPGAPSLSGGKSHRSAAGLGHRLGWRASAKPMEQGGRGRKSKPAPPRTARWAGWVFGRGPPGVPRRRGSAGLQQRLQLPRHIGDLFGEA